jgi:photosystem II stability/assembly factor-like uncharacterized protein
VVENTVENVNEATPMQDLVYSLAASPNFAQDHLCFAARQSGLYRSDDGGASWHAAYDSLSLDAPLATMAVVVSPNFESDRSVFAGVPGGIMRSVDGGQSWTAALLPSPPPLVATLAVSPSFAHDGIVLAGTLEDGVFRSADRGSRWARWNFGLLDLNVFCMALSPDFANDETLFVGTESGIFRSTNGGRAWREVDFPTEFAPVLSLAVSPDYTNDGDGGVLFAGTESQGLFCSPDRGRTWTRLGGDAVADAVNGILLSPEFPARPDVLVALSTALLISRDGGQTWADWQAGRIFEQGLTFVAAPRGLDPDAPLLVGLAEGGVLRTSP